MSKVRIHTRPGCPLDIVESATAVLRKAAEVMTERPSKLHSGYYDCRNRLRKHFETALGGHFTVVFIRGDVCYRVSVQRQDACRSYHRMILSGALRGEHLPRIHCTVAVGELFVSAMEVLDSTLGDAGRKIPAPILRALDNADALDYIGDEYQPEGWRVECEAPDPAWQETLEALTDSGIGNFDIHNENMMWRADGTLVLTDPVSFRYGA